MLSAVFFACGQYLAKAARMQEQEKMHGRKYWGWSVMGVTRFELQRNADIVSIMPVIWVRVGSNGAITISKPDLLMKNVENI